LARWGAVLTDGVTQAIERAQLNATLLAIEEINSTLYPRWRQTAGMFG